MNDKIKNFIENFGRSIVEKREGRAFLSGSIPGFFTGLFLFFNNPTFGDAALVANLIKLFMVFSMSFVTGLGGIAVKYVHGRVVKYNRKRKIKKYAKKRNDQRAA